MATTNIIVDVTIPAESLELGRILTEHPGITVRLERIVPLQSEVIPLMWVTNGTGGTIKAALQDHSQIEFVQSLTPADEVELFEVRWQPDFNGLIRAMVDADARMLKGEGTAEGWEFRLRFTAHEDLTAFNQTVTDQGIPLTLQQLQNPTEPDKRSTLSTKQRESIKQAYRRGYFNVPRDSTVSDLAASMNISDSAFSQRLRRGLSTLVQESFFSDGVGSRAVDRTVDPDE